jgi:hypothetical protein
MKWPTGVSPLCDFFSSKTNIHKGWQKWVILWHNAIIIFKCWALLAYIQKTPQNCGEGWARICALGKSSRQQKED